MSSYLELLEARTASGVRPIKRVPLCLDPARFDALAEAKEHLRVTERRTPTPQPGKASPSQKMVDTSPLTQAREAVEQAEDAVREASLILVIEGQTGDEIKDSKLAEGDRYGIILKALKAVEDYDGNPLPEIGPDKLVQLLPTLSSGELAVIYNAVTMATAAPDFPTLRRS